MLCAAATTAHIRGDHDDVLTQSAAAIETATHEDRRDHLALATALHGNARVRAGAYEDGLDELRRAIALQTATGAIAARPFVRGLLAGALAHAGETDLALNALDAALDPAGDRWYAPELHRLRAELLLAVGDLPAAHRSAGRALSIARHAGGWERHAAATLARLGGATAVA